MKVKYIKPKNIEKVFKEISDILYDITLDKMDKELFYDRMKFINHSIYWDEYKSTDEFDKLKSIVKTVESFDQDKQMLNQ